MKLPAGSRTTAISLVIFGVAVASYLAAMLVGPRVSDRDLKNHCATNYRVNSVLGHTLNCDSMTFIQDASDPRRLLAPDAVRQARPGTAIAGHFLGLVTEGIFNVLSFVKLFEITKYEMDFTRKSTGRNQREVTIDIKGTPGYELLYYYSALVLWNLILTLLIIFLHQRIIRTPWYDFRSPASWVSILYVANIVTNQFFYSPHTQIFTLLAPVLLVLACLKVEEHKNPSRVFIYYSGLFGILQLFYGLFFVAAAVLGLTYLIRKLGERRSLFDHLPVLAVGIGAIAAFGAPYLVWYVFIVHINGDFFNYDVEKYGGFTWMLQSHANDGFRGVFSGLSKNAAAYIQNAVMYGWQIPILAAPAVFVFVKSKNRIDDDRKHRIRSSLRTCLLYGILVTLLFSAYGLVVERLAFGLVAMCIPLIALLYSATDRLMTRTAHLTLFGLLAAYSIYSATRFGPYS